ENDSLTVSLENDVSNGTLSLMADGSFVYTPSQEFNGQDGFSYTVSDGSLTDTAQVTINVSSFNDAPVAADDTYTTDEDTPLTVAAPGVLSNDSDPENSSLSASLQSDVSNGTLDLMADGSFVYTPSQDFNGQDSFSYIVSDGILTDSADVTITVTSVNDTPQVEAGADQSANEGQEVQFEGSFSDPGRRLAASASIKWDLGDGTTVMDTLTPTHTYGDDGTFTATLTVTDTEGASESDSLMVTVNNVAPMVQASGNMTATAGMAIDFTGSFTDPGTLDTHTIVWDFGDGNSATDTLTPTHSYDMQGTFTVTLTVTDDDGGIGTDHLIVRVMDNDGVDDDMEDGAPNNGDGNNDGMPDSQQNNVASLPNSMDGGYVTLESPAGTMLVNLDAVANPSTSDAPEEVTFPQGFFDFNATGMTVGQTVVITLTLHTGESPTAYWKYGPTADDTSDHWYLFDYDGETGAQINGNIITLHFKDGKRGDSDLTENGQITDPGAPGMRQSPTALTLTHFEEQATTNSWAILALLSLLCAGFALRIRRSPKRQQ
ncbi:MAG: tandem-95 repeat protein, partial [Ardenticatenaceae bacterium]